MDKRKMINFTLIMMVIGFMLAVQFQTVKEPVTRDTRGTWQLREDLLKEKNYHQSLFRKSVRMKKNLISMKRNEIRAKNKY